MAFTNIAGTTCIAVIDREGFSHPPYTHKGTAQAQMRNMDENL